MEVKGWKEKYQGHSTPLSPQSQEVGSWVGFGIREHWRNHKPKVAVDTIDCKTNPIICGYVGGKESRRICRSIFNRLISVRPIHKPSSPQLAQRVVGKAIPPIGELFLELAVGVEVDHIEALPTEPLSLEQTYHHLL